MSEVPDELAYLVCEVDWESNDEGGYDWRGDGPVLAFRDRGRAEAHRVELEWKRRQEWNHPNPARFPLDCDSCADPGYLQFSTSLDEETLAGRLEERGLPLPEAGSLEGGPRYYWLDHEWWQQVLDRLPRAEWPWLWDLFDRVRFFEIVPVPLSDLRSMEG